MGGSSVAGSDMVVGPPTLLKNNIVVSVALPISVATTGWQNRRPRLTVRVDRWVQMRGWIGPRATHDYSYVHEHTMNT